MGTVSKGGCGGSALVAAAALLPVRDPLPGLHNVRRWRGGRVAPLLRFPVRDPLLGLGHVGGHARLRRLDPALPRGGGEGALRLLGGGELLPVPELGLPLLAVVVVVAEAGLLGGVPPQQENADRQGEEDLPRVRLDGAGLAAQHEGDQDEPPQEDAAGEVVALRVLLLVHAERLAVVAPRPHELHPPGLILAPPRLTSGYESAPPWDRTPKSASARRPPRTSSGTKGYAMKHVTAAKVELSRARVAVVRPASSLTCRFWSAGARFAGSGSAGLLLRYPGPAGLPWPFFWPAGLAVGGAACFRRVVPFSFFLLWTGGAAGFPSLVLAFALPPADEKRRFRALSVFGGVAARRPAAGDFFFPAAPPGTTRPSGRSTSSGAWAAA